MVDTKVQHHINAIVAGSWPRCRDVILRGDVLHCTLDYSQSYGLVEAYKYDPHIRFANAKTEQDLIAFIRAWGPPFVNPETSGMMFLSLGACRAVQQWFRAIFDLLAAFRRAEGEREALLEFVEAEYATVRSFPVEVVESNSLLALRNEFHVTGSIPEWIEGANLRSIRVATDHVIEKLPVGPLGAHLVCRRDRNHRHIEAGWNIPDLQNALHWMVWYDEFTQHPIICCKECRKVFRSETAHTRKYCSPDCAHRATGRAWQKRRAAERGKEKHGSTEGRK